MSYKLFVDTNVYLDFLIHRGKEWKNAELLFELAENKEITIYTSSSSLINIIYILRAAKMDHKEVIEAATAILNYTTLINPDNNTCIRALESSFLDTEDAVQYYTALENTEIDYFITTNTKDFKKALPTLSILTPTSFIQLRNKSHVSGK